MYQTKTDLWDERHNFEMSLAYIDPNIPRQNYRIDSVEELAEHFVMWEYAIAMCGYLMKVCPFDQPDVASAKAVVLDILREASPRPTTRRRSPTRSTWASSRCARLLRFRVATICGRACTRCFPRFSRRLLRAQRVFAVHGRGQARSARVRPPRRRRGVRVVSCLEVGPRYLHSTGQLQKGGPNCGCFHPVRRRAEGHPLAAGGRIARRAGQGAGFGRSDHARRARSSLRAPASSRQLGRDLRMLAMVVREIIADIIVDRALAEAEEAAEDAELEQARAEGAVVETAPSAPVDPEPPRGLSRLRDGGVRSGLIVRRRVGKPRPPGC